MLLRDGELWHQAFKLRRNPFAETDDLMSFHRLVDKEAWREVTRSLQSRKSIVAVGRMGPGKTNMATSILQDKTIYKALLESVEEEKRCGSIGRSRIIDAKGDLVKTGLIDAVIDKGLEELLTVLKDPVFTFLRPCKGSCIRIAMKEDETTEGTR